MGEPAITWALEERLKYTLVPGWLYIRYRTQKELRYGERELGLLPYLVDRSRNAIDAGANKGVYTHLIAKLARHTYAYEPNPKLYRILKRNIGGSITASPIALSDETGSSVLRIPYGKRGHSNQGASLSTIKVSDHFTAVDVKTARIDDLGLADIGFIKIDVEGHEDAVLRGAEQTIKRDRPAILVEIEEKHMKRPIEDELQKVLDLGYEGLFISDEGLRPLSQFDPVAHHRDPSRRYVFNFIFLPKERASALAG